MPAPHLSHTVPLECPQWGEDVRQLWNAVAGAVLAVTAVSSSTVPAYADPGRGEVLQSAADTLVDDGFPGATLFARVGEEWWSLASGEADVATGRPARPGDRVRIASNTKSFTATVILQLVGEGELSLDDSVERWLPGVVAGNGNDGSKVTVRQLLNHTSGIYDPTDLPEFFAPYFEDEDWDYVWTPRAVVSAAMEHPPTAPAGTAWSYSNTNYVLAGLVIEAVTGRSAVSEVTDRIIRPLRLDHNSFPVTDPRIRGRHLHGYGMSEQDLTVFSPSYDWTAGGIQSTVEDLATFHRALFGGELLEAEQQRELVDVVPATDAFDYGLGVQRLGLPCPGGGQVVLWGHDGSAPGFTSVSLTSDDGTRQLAVAMNVFDLENELHGEASTPESSGVPRALVATFCD